MRAIFINKETDREIEVYETNEIAKYLKNNNYKIQDYEDYDLGEVRELIEDELGEDVKDFEKFGFDNSDISIKFDSWNENLQGLDYCYEMIHWGFSKNISETITSEYYWNIETPFEIAIEQFKEQGSIDEDLKDLMFHCLDFNSNVEPDYEGYKIFSDFCVNNHIKLWSVIEKELFPIEIIDLYYVINNFGNHDKSLGEAIELMTKYKDQIDYEDEVNLILGGYYEWRMDYTIENPEHLRELLSSWDEVDEFKQEIYKNMDSEELLKEVIKYTR